MKNIRYHNESSTQSIIFKIFIILFLVIGIFSGLYGVDKIKNYYHPYAFFFIVSILGFLIGYFISELIKPFLKLNKKLLSQFALPKAFIIFGMLGIMMAICSNLNNNYSNIDFCGNYILIHKEYKPYRYRHPGANYLFVNIKGKTERLRCNFSYWEKKATGEKIYICIYKSKIGFDYMQLMDE
jgi:hypothetical protein